MGVLKTREEIGTTVEKIVDRTSIIDIHTHIYSPAFGGLLLWGIDELITYHYLVAESFRQKPMAYDSFWAMPKKEQAEHIWQQLFIENSPISESCRGVLTTLRLLGLDVRKRDLRVLRRYFDEQKVAEYVDTVYETANVRYVVMTNNPFDPEERPVWVAQDSGDDRFKAALRLDNVLMGWPKPVDELRAWGYKVTPELSDDSLAEIRRFLGDWTERMNALYMAVSLPPDFSVSDGSPRSTLIKEAVLPVARERGIPFAMMIGVKKLTNPALDVAGDSVGKADNDVLEGMCRDYPDNRFMVTYLSRENQHECCITARKFHNLMPFGCWWFMNNPSIINEITRERIELLGISFIPQHSDARVLDQLIYKWSHSRGIIADILTDKYADVSVTGWEVTEDDIERDVENLFGANFEKFLKGTPKAE